MQALLQLEKVLFTQPAYTILLLLGATATRGCDQREGNNECGDGVLAVHAIGPFRLRPRRLAIRLVIGRVR